jgi:cell wall-associated NlpC family hydrolase
MDCSGLVDYVYKNAEGKQLPHNTVALESCVNQHSVSQAQAGDILFWGQHGATYHSAIYIGNNQYVAAAKPGTNVSTYTISSYFMPSFAGTVK